LPDFMNVTDPFPDTKLSCELEFPPPLQLVIKNTVSRSGRNR